MVGGLEHDWIFFSIFYMGCHPKPIDELHHFSRWLVNHQPENGEDERNNTCWLKQNMMNMGFLNRLEEEN